MRDVVLDAMAPAEAPSRNWDDELSLKSMVTAIRQRWFVVIPVFLAVLAVGTWRTLNEPRRYRAFATVRVSQQRAPIPGLNPGWASVDYRFDRMVAEQRIISSAAVAQRVAQREGLRLRIAEPSHLRRGELFGDRLITVDSAALSGEYRVRFGDADYTLTSGESVIARAPYGQPVVGRGFAFTIPSRPDIEAKSVVLEVVPMGAAIAEVQGGIQTGVVEKTDIIEISYTGTDPLLVQRITNDVATAYAEFSKENARAEQQRKIEFIAQNLREQRDSVFAAQESLKAFREGNQLTDVSAEQLALQARISEFETQRRETEIEQRLFSALQRRVSEADSADLALRRLLGAEAVSKSQQMKELSDRWFELEKERQGLIASGKDDRNQDVAAANALIARTKQDLASAAGVYLASLDARISTLDNQLAELRNQTTRFPGLSATEKNLEGRVKSLQKIYDDLQQQYQLSRIEQSVDASTVQPIDMATVPQWPVSPNRKRDVMFAAVIGLMLGMLLAVLLDKLDNSVRSPDELRDQLELPVLGMIPAIRLDGEHQTTSAGAPLERLVTHADPRSPVAEAYRSMRTNLAFARAHQDVRTIVLTSPGPADGKSTTVANLAITFAQQGQRTLLIDADLRRAVLDKTFGVPRSPGLTEVIIGSVPLVEAVNETQVPNLFVLGSGQFPPNPSELLGSSAMKEVLAAAKEQFDVVLFDTPPLLAVTDAAVLSTQVDGTILVVRMNSTAREAARRALSQLRAVHARVLGALLNDVRHKGAGYYGGYGYAYYAYYGADTNGDGAPQGNGVLGRIRRFTGLEKAGRGDG